MYTLKTGVPHNTTYKYSNTLAYIKYLFETCQQRLESRLKWADLI